MNKSVLKTLVGIKMSAIWSSFSNKQTKKIKKVLYGLLYIYLAAVLLFYFGFLFNMICKPYCTMGLSWFYFGFASIFALLFCFIGSVFTTQTQLYKATDNDLLLSMPIKPGYILASRMISVLIWNYFYAMVVLIPAGVVYCMNFTPSVMGIVIYVILSFAIPLLSQALACAAAFVLELISSRMKNKNIITMIFSVVFLGAYFMFCFRINSYLGELLTKGNSIAAAVRKAFFPAYYFGKAIVERDMLAFIITLAISVAPFAAVCWILSRNFASVISMKRGEDKKKYVEKTLNTSSPVSALFKKELGCFTSSAGYMLNAGLGCVFTVILCIMFAVKSDDVMMVFGLMEFDTITISILMAAAISFTVSMNFISAPSVSLEAKTLWILKTIPVKGVDILMAKVYLHCAVTCPFALVSSLICAFVLKPDAASLAILIFLPQIVAVFSGFLGVTVNLQFPKFNWTSEVQAVKQSLSTLLCMLGTMVLVMGIFMLYVTVFIDIISVTVYTFIVMAVMAGLCALMYLYLGRGGTRKLMSL